MKRIGASIFFLMTLICLNSCTHSNANSSNNLIINSDSSSNTIETLNKYVWKTDYDAKNSIINRIAVPDGFKRVEVKPGSFADWLRYLPLKPGNPNVHLSAYKNSNI